MFKITFPLFFTYSKCKKFQLKKKYLNINIVKIKILSFQAYFDWNIVK